MAFPNGPAQWVLPVLSQTLLRKLILETDYRPEQPFSFLCHTLFLLLPVSPVFWPAFSFILIFQRNNANFATPIESS